MEGGICTKLSLHILEDFIGFLKESPTCPGLPRAVLVLVYQVPCPKNLCGAGKIRMVGHLLMSSHLNGRGYNILGQHITIKVHLH